MNLFTVALTISFLKSYRIRLPVIVFVAYKPRVCQINTCNIREDIHRNANFILYNYSKQLKFVPNQNPLNAYLYPDCW